MKKEIIMKKIKFIVLLVVFIISTIHIISNYEKDLQNVQINQLIDLIEEEKERDKKIIEEKGLNNKQIQLTKEIIKSGIAFDLEIEHLIKELRYEEKNNYLNLSELELHRKYQNKYDYIREKFMTKYFLLEKQLYNNGTVYDLEASDNRYIASTLEDFFKIYSSLTNYKWYEKANRENKNYDNKIEKKLKEIEKIVNENSFMHNYFFDEKEKTEKNYIEKLNQIERDKIILSEQGLNENDIKIIENLFEIIVNTKIEDEKEFNKLKKELDNKILSLQKFPEEELINRFEEINEQMIYFEIKRRKSFENNLDKLNINNISNSYVLEEIKKYIYYIKEIRAGANNLEIFYYKNEFDFIPSRYKIEQHMVNNYDEYVKSATYILYDNQYLIPYLKNTLNQNKEE